jgi:nucleoside-diphosphate-sugar epimerase
MSNPQGADPVLVTGGTGFVGRALVEKLVGRGETVRVVGRRWRARWRKDPGIEHVRADISEPGVIEEALRGVSRIVHLAASTQGNWNVHRTVTVDASGRLLDAMASQGGGRIVFVSSLGNYDTASMRDGIEIDESFPLERNYQARSDYVRAKTESDLLAQNYLSHPTIKMTIVRPGLIYGPGMKNPLAGLAMPVVRLVLVVLGTLDRPLPLIYLDDAVNGLIRLMDCERAAGGVYNLVSVPMPGSREYLKLYRELSGDRRPMIRLPLHRMTWLFSAIDRTTAALGGSEPNLSYKLSKFTKRVVYSSRKARLDSGFMPRYSLEAAMRQIFPAEK